MRETINAIIVKAYIRTENNCPLICIIELNYGVSTQRFGDIAIYLPKTFKYHNVLSVAGHFIHRVMSIAGVKDWDDLPGKSVRVLREDGFIHAIGNIVNNDWFFPANDYSEIQHMNDLEMVEK